MKRAFFNSKGEIRLIWLIALIICLYFAAVGGMYLLYWYMYRTMMSIWGVTSQNIVRAPGTVQFLYGWSNVIVQLLQNGLLVLFALAVKKLVRPEEKRPWAKRIKGAGIGAAAGGLCIALLWGMLLMTGSVRLGWRLSRPAFSVNTFALSVTSLAASVAESMFFYGAIRRVMKQRLPVWAAHGVVIGLNAAALLLSGAFKPVVLLNGALSALVCCLLAERSGTCAAAGFRFAWSYLMQAVFGFAGATAALYETYPVNMYWLNGGNAGVMNGAGTTVMLLLLAFLLLPDKRAIKRFIRKGRNKSPS